MAPGNRIGRILKPPFKISKRKRSLSLLVFRGLVLFLVCEAFFIRTTISSRIPRRNFSPFPLVPSGGSSSATQSESFTDRSLIRKTTTTSTSSVPKKTLKLSIYYETLCPDSLDFLKSHVKPLLELPYGHTNNDSAQLASSLLFHALLEIKLIPYGKAMTLLRLPAYSADTDTNAANTGEYSFLCQHGPLECEGNKLHACMLEVIPPLWKSDELSLQRSLMGFFVCSMELLINIYYQEEKDSFETVSRPVHPTDKKESVSSHIKYVIKMCSHELHVEKPIIAKLSSPFHERESQSNFVSAAPAPVVSSYKSLLFARVQNCLENEQHSTTLLKVNGELTSKLRPKVTFIPWLTFNEVWDESLMKNGLKDLHRVMCGLMVSSLHGRMRETLLKDGRVGTPFQPRIIGCETYE